jgi:hypothetical protein
MDDFLKLRFGRYKVRETVCGASFIEERYAVAQLVVLLQPSGSIPAGVNGIFH